MDKDLITWEKVYDDFKLHFPDVESVDYRPYMASIIYMVKGRARNNI